MPIASVPASPTIGPTASPIDCLVVDDSDAIRRIIKHMLMDMRMSVSEASCGDAALARCAQAMPGIVVLDWYMPGPAGVDCLRALRRLPGGHRPRVIACMSENDAAETANAVAAGADAVIVKPFNQAGLRAKLTGMGIT